MSIIDTVQRLGSKSVGKFFQESDDVVSGGDPFTDVVTDGGMEPVEIGDVILIPAVHVSEATGRRVQQTIDEHNPETIAVELDHQRYESMMAEGAEDDQNLLSKVKSSVENGLSIRALPLYLYMLVQQHYAESAYGNAETGVGIRTAVETAQEEQTDLALIDANMQNQINKIANEIVTTETLSTVLSRTNRARKDASGVYDFTKKFSQHVFDPGNNGEFIEQEMHDLGIDTLTLGVRGIAPFEELDFDEVDRLRKVLRLTVGDTVYEHLIRHRDREMAGKLNAIESNSGGKIVAVVGKAHIPGIKRDLESFGFKPAE